MRDLTDINKLAGLGRATEMTRSDGRLIALHANQNWRDKDPWTGKKRRASGFILMTEVECEHLERALRLARTRKTGTERRVVTSTPDRYEYGLPEKDNPVAGTTFVIKSFITEADNA